MMQAACAPAPLMLGVLEFMRLVLGSLRSMVLKASAAEVYKLTPSHLTSCMDSLHHRRLHRTVLLHLYTHTIFTGYNSNTSLRIRLYE